MGGGPFRAKHKGSNDCTALRVVKVLGTVKLPDSTQLTLGKEFAVVKFAVLTSPVCHVDGDVSGAVSWVTGC